MAPLPLVHHRVSLPANQLEVQWLDQRQPSIRKWGEVNGLNFGEGTTASYYTMPSSVHAEIRLLAGRFDLAVTEQGMKVYEYNCDSGSCMVECCEIQGSWSKGLNLVGQDAGYGAAARLRAGISDLNLGSETILHILHDVDEEETCHALYIRDCAVAVGIPCKEIVGLTGLHFDTEGRVLDEDGIPIQRLWKSWSYDTILSEWDGGALHTSGDVRLVDLCLRNDIDVFEPLWAAIPANKAILAVLWKLYPRNKYLLKSELELSDELRDSGYVEKPVNGRAGQNIVIFEGRESKSTNQNSRTGGKFIGKQIVYQELFGLPSFDEEVNKEYVQVSTFVVGGHYSGTVLRTDETPIVKYASGVAPLRITDDGSNTLDDGAIITSKPAMNIMPLLPAQEVPVPCRNQILSAVPEAVAVGHTHAYPQMGPACTC